MEKFSRLDAVAVPLDVANCDTDRIIPARFLRARRGDGYGQNLFRDVRYDSDGNPNPDFPLNKPAYKDARILVADVNFACGSSREGAVYALHDAGFRAVIAPSFGDIFFNNCFKNGFLPIVLPAEDVAAIRRSLSENPGTTLSIDLERQTVTRGNDVWTFAVEPLRKQCLLEGLDDIQLTMKQESSMSSFEQRYKAERPWLAARP
ncbi:MAG: 3-isopropylmalate dehydratase small subunit [Alphaproteobacteria bacterium]|nr:3-isopropylmalate dehydratase small subunit [Alphaproteobacteria bacterium]